MEELKLKFRNFVSDHLAAAPESSAKADLIEELSDNLYQRYLEMTAAGMAEAEAFQTACDDLGDTAELVDYLKGLEPDEPLPEMVLDPDKALEDILKNVEEIAKSAMSQAKNLLQDFKINVAESGMFQWKSEDGEMEFRFDSTDGDRDEAADGPDGASDGGSDPSEDSADGQKMGFTFDLDTDKGEFVMGGTPRPEDPEKDVIYGVGYDKAKGGFFAQWGEYKGSYHRPVDGPVPSQALKGIDVQTVSGDVTIRMTENPDGDVIIDGDVEELDVRRSDDGVLTISQGKTASSSFFFGRGLSCADVILYLPRRQWEFLKVSSVSGDIHIDGDNSVELVTVKTTSGDMEGGLPGCKLLSFKSISGDLNWTGDAEQLQAATTSGDLTVIGRLGEAQTSSISGDVHLQGSVTALRCVSTSGDVTVHSGALPRHLEASSRSGDCVVYLPDRGPFSVHYRTGSGTFRSDFFTGSMGARENTFDYGEGGPTYHMTSTSGDLRLKKF